MKLLCLLAISSLIIASSESFYYLPPPFYDVFFQIVLKADEPIPNNETLYTVEIQNATGSIGAKTFSSLPNLSTLIIKRSTISHIEDGVLCTSQLEALTIENNEQFPKLTKALLSNCNKLKRLHLQNVEMEPDALNYMVNLETIILEGLRNFHLAKDYLEPLKNLKVLELGDSEITQIDGGIICSSPKLVEIYITNNKILPVLTKPIFENCKNVWKLTFRDNQEMHVDEDTFSAFQKLARARFDNLILTHLTKQFLIGFKRIEVLDIFNSGISKIDGDAFTGLSHLEHLRLDGNNLTEINFDVNLNRLRTLSFDGNKITEVDSEVISHFPNLERLDVMNNRLVNIDGITHPKLKELNVHGNNVSHIGTDALKRNLPKLEVLSIGNNPMSLEYVNELKKELAGIRINGYFAQRLDK